ncbi:MAG TPA: hypothetical protein VEX60_15015, partial [Pyrinomonadaceae bacterium]|nr:hypothetical protein [Pyrinomonadaceae bacterium]
TFRKAVSSASSNASGTGTPRLTRWLSYDSTYTDRVALTSGYTPLSGMAFGVDSISDPDNSDIVTFSTSGLFANGGASQTLDGLTLTYTPRASNTVTTSTSGASDLGSFSMSASNGTHTWTNAPFTLTITQTGPWAVTKDIACTISGTAIKTGSNFTGTLIITFPSLSYSLDGVSYKLAALTAALPADSTTTVGVTLSPPEPQRLVVKVKGYGPRNAVKKMQMLVSRSAFDYNATGGITLRSADDNTSVISPFSVGNSAQYQYNGNDNSAGPSLPAIAVTSDVDLTMVSNAIDPTQVFGSQSVRKVPLTSLDTFLRTTDGANGARTAVQTLKTLAMGQKWPINCTGTTAQCDRYFGSGETPSDLGATQTDGLMTFVDGDIDLPPQGGAGLLVVTGTLTLNGSSSFNGLILVLGGGTVVRTGGGNGISLGAVAVARFDATGNFLAPAFNSNGSGTSTMRYDSEWIKKALKGAGPGVVGISEY